MKLPSNQELYEASVQNAKVEIDQFDKMFRQCVGGSPLSFREDFCASFALSAEWVRRGGKRVAHAIDLDDRPLAYGRMKHFPLLSESEKRRIHIHRENVLHAKVSSVDLIAASNFATFYFKTKNDLLRYYRSSFEALKRGGVFSVDLLGGIEQQSPNRTKTKMKMENGFAYTYVWEQTSYNPITNEGLFHIHFEFSDGTKRKKAFTYDWRIWSIPEIREAMEEAGFAKSYVFWEGDNLKGGGNGKFHRTTHEENCESWLAYVVGCKI